MSVFFWLLLLVAAYGAKINKEGCYSDYIGRDSIQPIKGIFLLTLPMCVVFDSLTPKAWNAMMSLAPKKKA